MKEKTRKWFFEKGGWKFSLTIFVLVLVPIISSLIFGSWMITYLSVAAEVCILPLFVLSLKDEPQILMGLVASLLLWLVGIAMLLVAFPFL